MPYDTPYNRYIAKLENQSNEAYADYNAFSNQMYNTTLNKPFSEIYKELRLPERHFQRPSVRISNADGGITGVNGEGYAGYGSYVAKQMRHSRLGEDTRRPLFTAESASEAEESESDDAMSGKGEDSDSEEETENRIVGMAQPMKCMPVKGLVKEHKQLVKVLEDKSGNHSAVMKKEAMKQKKELKALEGGDQKRKKADKQRKTKAKTNQQKKASREGALAQMMDANAEAPMAEAPQEPIYDLAMNLGPGHIENYHPNNPDDDGYTSGGRKPSKWIAFVKSWAAENKMSYRDALKSPKLKADYAKHKTGGFAFLPLLASVAAPYVMKGVKSLVNKVRGKGENKSGGSVIGGPANDPVNSTKITGLGHPMTDFVKKMKTKKVAKVVAPAPAVVASGKKKGGKIEPQEKFYPPTGNYFEGASLGAGKKKGRGKGKKTGASLFKTPSVQPSDVKSTPSSQDQIENVASLTEVKGNGRKKRRTKAQMAEAKAEKEGGAHKLIVKSEMPGVSVRGGAKKPSAWIAHCKAYAKEHKCSYKEAMKLAKASYKK